MKAALIMEDGSLFDGISVGVAGETIGEVVLNTAVTGYQEMMTDPANAGKILVLTYPLIGNYGVAKKFNESGRVWVSGLIIKEPSRIYSNWQAEGSFDDFLKREKVVAAADVDTRTLAITIRDKGQMLGMISTRSSDRDKLLKKLRQEKKNGRADFISAASTMKAAEIKGKPSGARIAVLDLGMPQSLIRQLKTLGCNITLLPYNTSAQAIRAMKPDGLIISSGPEGDAAIAKVVDEVKTLIGKVPMLGIGLGHEIIGLAIGAKLKKMKVGHHGVNYPVRGADSFKGEITVQNHSYVVDEASIPKKAGVNITLRNINDKTVEEMESRTSKFISAQYSPASPGFEEVNPLFCRFLKLCAPKNTRPRNSSANTETLKRKECLEYAKA
ncbi:MAG: glutamine-hydrolyzing carbamoyl-phosphate synthase small subunit [Candidatus Omnitrophica bacterium]|nr:glutamine-hydrolyzing carbamoyl-phosphate synthase small subunit [Candidatus Omnitrophota bacterium]